MNDFYPLSVTSITRPTRDAVVVTFDVPAPLRENYSFRSGQYLTLRADIDGEDLRRSYSICSAPEDGVLRLSAWTMACSQLGRIRNSWWAKRST